jgi:hypothetical protein
MRSPRMQFTIRTLMFAVAAVAGLMVLWRWPVWLFTLATLSCFSFAWGLWRVFRGFRRLSAPAFGVAAAATNVFCALVSVYALGLGGSVLVGLSCFIGMPVILGLGSAWSTRATRHTTIPRRSRWIAWPLTIVLALMPLTILITAWPFRLVFFASRPSLERLADRVAAGQAVGFPRWAGGYVVVGSVVDSTTGNVGLIVDADPAGRSGFVRVCPGKPSLGPFVNLNYHLRLSDDWSYDCED